MTEPKPFVTYLESLREDRGALAALRRGLGQPPGTAREMYPYVVRWLPAETSAQREAAYYLIAALFAYHPDPGGSGNLGHAFRRTLDPTGDNTATERRFTALLTAHPNDLPFYLRQAISFLASKEAPVDWNQLFADLLAWGHPAGYVQKQWARAFWGRAADEDTSTTKEN
jgi:CRISPR system Cascade subunit CasB